MKKKMWLLIPLLVVIAGVIWYFSSTQWTRDFEIRYVDYVSERETGNHSGSSYYLYEITNTTNHTFTEVTVVISVDRVGQDFTYEDSIPFGIKPGETVEYRLYVKDCQKQAEERDIELIFSSAEIVKIKYSK